MEGGRDGFLNTSWLLPTSCPLPVLCVVLEQIRSAVGAAQMLMSQKVQQFFRLCQQSVVSECV